MITGEVIGEKVLFLLSLALSVQSTKPLHTPTPPSWGTQPFEGHIVPLFRPQQGRDLSIQAPNDGTGGR